MLQPREKRKCPRMALRAPVVLQWHSPTKGGFGTVSNMSTVGCYVLTQVTGGVGERIRVQLERAGLPEIECMVCYVDANVGMGLEFVGVPGEVQRKLDEFLKTNAPSSSEAGGATLQ